MKYKEFVDWAIPYKEMKIRGMNNPSRRILDFPVRIITG